MPQVILFHDPSAKIQEEKWSKGQATKHFRVVCDVKKFKDGSSSFTVIEENIDCIHKAAQIQNGYNNRRRNLALTNNRV